MRARHVLPILLAVWLGGCASSTPPSADVKISQTARGVEIRSSDKILFDSGKADGFKALIYMHRYNADTSGLVRADYLYKMEQVYESEIARMDDAIANGASREVAQATKRKEKLQKQLKECRDYDEMIAHLADFTWYVIDGAARAIGFEVSPDEPLVAVVAALAAQASNPAL